MSLLGVLILTRISEDHFSKSTAMHARVSGLRNLTKPAHESSKPSRAEQLVRCSLFPE